MPAELSTEHKEAWVAFLLSGAKVNREIDRRMEEAGVIDMAVYDVLLRLEEAPDRRMKMTDLAEAVIFSKSGITRLVDRLVKDGLVERQSCPSDRRRVHAFLTDKGLAVREHAWPFYREAIAELFAANMSQEEAVTIAKILGRMMGPRCC